MPAVTVEVGEITSRLVHAIVHSSSPLVTFEGRDGLAIRDACGGAAFERAVAEALETQFDARLDTGDCLVTDAGAAKGFRWVLHVPATDGELRDPETGGVTGPTRICDCTYAFLDHAAELAKREGLDGKLDIASTLLGVDASAVNASIAARAMVAAQRDFLRSSQASSLRSIALIASSEEEASIIRGALEA